MNLTAEELEQIKFCRNGILSASGLGALFGLYGGKIALGSAPASLLSRSAVTGVSILTGLIVGAGISVQQSYNYLKSKPTNLAEELKKYSSLKKNIYRSQNQPEVDDKLKEIFNKRISKLPPFS